MDHFFTVTTQKACSASILQALLLIVMSLLVYTQLALSTCVLSLTMRQQQDSDLFNTAVMLDTMQSHVSITQAVLFAATSVLPCRGQLASDEVQLLLWQILHVLKYLHANHVWHRDLKSANVLVKLENGQRIIKVRCICPFHSCHWPLASSRLHWCRNDEWQVMCSGGFC